MPDDRYFEPELETASRGDLRALQEERLAEVVPYVYERSPLIRHLWEEAGLKPADVRTLDDLRERAPFVTKDWMRRFRDERGDVFGGLLCQPLDQATAALTTTGTTGEPTLYAETYGGWSPRWTVSARAVWEMGVRPGDHILALCGSFRGQAYHQAQAVGAIPVFVNNFFGHWAEALPAVKKYEVTYFQLLGPLIVELEHLAEHHDLRDIFSSVKGVGFAGEPLGRHMRGSVASWGLELFEYTSTGDVSIAYDCREHAGRHVPEDIVFVELVDPDTGEPLPEEAELGEMVATALDDPAWPVVRFRTDDLVRRTTEICGCGRTQQRIVNAGRKGEETVVQGKAVMPLDVWAALEDVPETADALFQIIRPQREVDVLRLRVGYDDEHTRDVADVADRVRAAVLAKTGVEPELEMETQAQILSRAAVSKLPRLVKR